MVRLLSYILVLCILVGCKSTSNIANKATTKNMKITKVIKKHRNSNSEFKTLKATLKVNIVSGEEEDNVTVDVRMIKDSVIWMSFKKVGFSGAKVLMTKDKIQYYNKLEKHYFDGDFSFVSGFVGTRLNFYQVQSILLAESMINLNDKDYNLEVLDTGYLIRPNEQEPNLEKYITIHPSNYKTMAQEVSQPNLFRIFTVHYNSFQDVAGNQFPKQLEVNAVESSTETKIYVDYKKVLINQKFPTPFKIPEGYNLITIE